MFSNVKCLDNRSYYDLDILNKAKRPIDNLLQLFIYNNPNLNKYYNRNSALKSFNNISLQLVLDFKIGAKKHIDMLITNSLQYGTLYYLFEQNLFNMLDIDYSIFPFIVQEEKDLIMTEIHKIALKYSKKGLTCYDITCLELLYFFALIVNPNHNWITIDYISKCNKRHQYVINIQTYSSKCK